ncbi:unnamed protein product, partial [Candidula unifasciata]
TVEHCYYHGSVRKDEWSSVAVSTCNGIRGVIQMHNETYIIHPLIKDDEDLEHPHVIFKASVSHMMIIVATVMDFGCHFKNFTKESLLKEPSLQMLRGVTIKQMKLLQNCYGLAWFWINQCIWVWSSVNSMSHSMHLM